MAKVCAICQKGSLPGRKYKRRGLAKAKGGAGSKITGKTHRRFLPNLQRIRIRLGKSIKPAYVCVRCIKAGKIQKA
ncbi:MAG: L28 family ribosomal protein [Candidatus Omnitrophota bacterium]